jgi:hypothetical protein
LGEEENEGLSTDVARNPGSSISAAKVRSVKDSVTLQIAISRALGYLVIKKPSAQELTLSLI